MPPMPHQVLHWHQQFFGEFCKLIKGRGHFLFSIAAEIHSQLLHGIDVWLKMWYVVWGEKTDRMKQKPWTYNWQNKGIWGRRWWGIYFIHIHSWAAENALHIPSVLKCNINAMQKRWSKKIPCPEICFALAVFFIFCKIVRSESKALERKKKTFALVLNRMSCQLFEQWILVLSSNATASNTFPFSWTLISTIDYAIAKAQKTALQKSHLLLFIKLWHSF